MDDPASASAPITSIQPAVAAVLLDRDGRLLLHRRRVGDGWAPPSGAVEPGETVLAALHREIQEETALTVAVERPIGVYSDPAYQVVRYPDGRVVHFVTTLFRCPGHRRDAGRLGRGIGLGLVPADALPPDLTAYARVWLADALADNPQLVIR